jgi:hypothetical protein
VLLVNVHESRLGPKSGVVAGGSRHILAHEKVFRKVELGTALIVVLSSVSKCF